MSNTINRRLEKDVIVRIHNSIGTILGREIGTGNLYMTIHDLTKGSEIIEEDSFKETWIFNPLLYLIQHRLKPEVRENIRKTKKFYSMLEIIKERNINDMSEDVKEKLYRAQVMQAYAWDRMLTSV